MIAPVKNATEPTITPAAAPLATLLFTRASAQVFPSPLLYSCAVDVTATPPLNTSLSTPS